MSKTGRWRTENNKIKALFFLRFHATGVAQVAGDSLLISLIPADVGKPTVRSDKAVIQEGSCYWEKPIHESLRLFREPRTGKFQEKIYYFVISNGWSKADFVGEASIDFASYAESFKASSVSLPLKNSKCDAVLHVSIQRVQEDVDQREIEETECASSPLNDRCLRARLNNSDAEETIKSEYTFAPRSPLSNEIPVTPERKRNNRESCGSDLTISSSENSYGFKENIAQQDPTSVLPTIHSLSNSTCLDTDELRAATSLPPDDVAAPDLLIKKPDPDASSQPRGVLSTKVQESEADTSATLDDVATYDGIVTKYELVPSSLPTTRSMHLNAICLDNSQSCGTSATPDDVAASGWLVPKANGFPKIVHQVYPTPEASTDDSSDSPPRGFILLGNSLPSSTLVVDELRAEISTLSRKAEVAELELKTLRKMIVKETHKGQELLREVVSLKDEKTALSVELEKYMEKKKVENGDPRALIGELRQELYYEKERNANLRVQLMKMQESNSELILAIRELDEMLEQKDNEIINLSNGSKLDIGDYEEQKNADLANELEIYRKDKEDLEGHIEQLVLDYEILKQENGDLLYQLEQSQAQEQLKLQYECSSSYDTVTKLQTKVENLEKKLEKQSSKFSESLGIIAELEEYAKGLVDDLEKQAQAFEDDIAILTGEKVEMEMRAITAEEVLRKTRWQNGKTAEKIHEEFRRLSVEMTSTLKSNETFTKNALSEANELNIQKSFLESLLKKSKEELHSINIHYEEKINELSSQLNSKVNYIENLENEKEQGEEGMQILSEEILMLRAEIETLKTENDRLSAEEERLKGELKQVNVSIREKEMVLERVKMEMDEKEREVVHLQEEAQQLANKLNSLGKEKDEKKIFIENLKSELERLQNQHNELKHLLSEDELQKENLKKKIMLLEGQIKMNEDALETSMNSFSEKEIDFRVTIDELERRLEDSQKSATCLQKMQMDEENETACLDGNTPEVSNITAEKGESESSDEIVLLKERNKEMENELKEMQERYSEISLKLAEVEGGRQQLMMRVRNLKNAKKS